MQLVADNIACRRGDRLVLADVSLSIPSGGMLAVTGPNGSGKSTLLRLLAGLLRPASGAIRFEGGNPELTIGEQTHYLGHLDPVKARLSVADNLRAAAALCGQTEARALDEALVRVGLSELRDLPGAVLSAGQRRRLSLARLLAVARPIWLLDEPSAGLDAAGRTLLTSAMEDHRQRGGIIVIATHDRADAAHATELALGAAS